MFLKRYIGNLLAFFSHLILFLKTGLIEYHQIHIVWCAMSLFRADSGPENGPSCLWEPCRWFCFVCLLSHFPAACYFAICLSLFNFIGMNKQKLADKVNLGTSPRKILISLPLNVRKCKGAPLTRQWIPSSEADGFNSVYSFLTS